MSNLIDFFMNNFTMQYGGLVAAVLLGIIWMIVYDFYHMFFSAVLSWFKK